MYPSAANSRRHCIGKARIADNWNGCMEKPEPEAEPETEPEPEPKK